MKLLAGLVARSCRRCSRKFESKPKAHGQRFCSEKCRALHYFKTVYYPRHVQSKKPRWIVRNCKNMRCRNRFSVDGRGRGKQHRLFCSDPCARSQWQRDYRARKAVRDSLSVGQ